MREGEGDAGDLRRPDPRILGHFASAYVVGVKTKVLLVYVVGVKIHFSR